MARPHSNIVTPQYLLEGALYALEQCGILLHDAVTLYRDGAYPSAIVLAVFAREELGRFRILLGLRKDVISGQRKLTTKDIQKECEDHVRKQEWGQLSTTIFSLNDSVQGRLILETRLNPPSSSKWKEATRQLDRAMKAVRKRTPSHRHDMRMKALYVEPADAGNGWNRPSQEYRDQAVVLRFINEAVGDYTGQHSRYAQGYVPEEEDELFRIIQEWDHRPELPLPEWP